ncbi:MAG: hypothetical protein ACFCUS_04385 [Rubrimonas sp.]
MALLIRPPRLALVECDRAEQALVNEIADPGGTRPPCCDIAQGRLVSERMRGMMPLFKAGALVDKANN